MNVSLGEIEATLRKAARGAGWCWGYAEELAAAARGLEAAGHPGVALATTLLQQADHYGCPIRAAARCCDSDRLPREAIELRCALLALPLLARHFCQVDSYLTAVRATNHVTLNSDGFIVDSIGIIDSSHQSIQLQVKRQQQQRQKYHLMGQGAAVSVDDWHSLEEFAMASYVPATEQSRKNAGPSE